MGIVYLVQPSTLLQTDRYKVGRSSKNDLSRLKSYLKGTRYLCIHECVDDVLFERQLLERFNSMFELIAGNEYFRGDELQMIDQFNDVVSVLNRQLRDDKKATWMQRFSYGARKKDPETNDLNRAFNSLQMTQAPNRKNTTVETLIEDMEVIALREKYSNSRRRKCMFRGSRY